MTGIWGPITFLIGVALGFVHPALAVIFWVVVLVPVIVVASIRGMIKAGRRKAERDAYFRKLLDGEVPFSHEYHED